ncbi:MAG: flavodoxin [Peptococcaceae bacterium]|nr:flavodoxin [Peptococcaceae bacterium]
MTKSIIITHSYHHRNTQKIAAAIAAIMDATLVEIKEDLTLNLDEYELFGFGAGIDGGKHYPEMLAYVTTFPSVQNKKAFIFSTSATFSEKRMPGEHKALRDLLQAKGFVIVGEFGCKGFTTRSIFNWVGGANKGHPNVDDLINAERFAERIKLD